MYPNRITIKTYEQKSILRVGLIQQANNGNIADNRSRLCEKMRRLAADGAQLIVNQELHDSLYFCQTESTDMCDLAVAIPRMSPDVFRPCRRARGSNRDLSFRASRSGTLSQHCGCVWEADGSVAGMYRKMHIPTIRHITRSFISLQATLDSNLSTLR